MSDFGPANAVGGVWECPDLFPLAVDGDPTKTKWVMVVNLNPGGIQGGSAGQYFVGDFDGKRFTADDAAPTRRPQVTCIADFEGADYGAWTTTGTAFGAGPAARDVARPADRLRLQRARPRQQLHRLRRLAGHAHVARVHHHARLREPPRRRRRASASARSGRRYAARRPSARRLRGRRPTAPGRRPGTSPAPRPSAAATAARASGSSTRSSARARTATTTAARSSHPNSTSTPTTSASSSPAAPSRRPRSGCWSTAPSCAPPRVARAGT